VLSPVAQQSADQDCEVHLTAACTGMAFVPLCATMANGCPICRSHIDNAVVCDDWWSVKCCQQIFSIKYINNTKHQTPFVVALADTEMECDTNYIVPYMLLDCDLLYALHIS